MKARTTKEMLEAIGSIVSDTNQRVASTSGEMAVATTIINALVQEYGTYKDGVFTLRAPSIPRESGTELSYTLEGEGLVVTVKVPPGARSPSSAVRAERDEDGNVLAIGEPT